MSKPQPNDDIVRLAQARNPQEAYIWCNALKEEGIDCSVVGDELTSGFGDLTPTAPEVWVHKKDLAKAQALLEAHQGGATANDEEE